MKQKTPSQTFVHDGVFLSYSAFGDFSDKDNTHCASVFMFAGRAEMRIGKCYFFDKIAVNPLTFNIRYSIIS